MVDSRIFSKKFTTLIIKLNSKLPSFGTSIDLLMIWLLTPSNQAVDSFGPVKTTMEMFSLISLLKVMDLSVL